MLTTSPARYTMNIKNGGAIMDVVLNKWGNSLGLRIPREMVDAFKLQPGTKVKVTTQDSKITIEPAVSVESLFEDYYGKPMNSITREDVGTYAETDWGNDVGGEVIE